MATSGARRRRVWLALASALAEALLAGPFAPVGAARSGYVPRLHGRVVRVTRLGAAPNGDPRAALVLLATLHDPAWPLRRSPTPPSSCAAIWRSSARAPPPLPDLLRPTQPAAALVGFLHGQAALAARSDGP